MALASYFFVGSEEEMQQNNGLEGGPDERRAEFYRVHDTSLSPLYQLITGQDDAPKFELSAHTDEYDLVTFRFPGEFVDALAAFDESRFGETIAAWRNSEDVPYDNEPDLRDLLTALIRLAGVSKASAQDMYLWNCI